MQKKWNKDKRNKHCVRLSAQGLALHEVFLTVIFRIPGFGCTYLNSYDFSRSKTGKMYA